jgi:hypothetical protein
MLSSAILLNLKKIFLCMTTNLHRWFTAIRLDNCSDPVTKIHTSTSYSQRPSQIYLFKASTIATDG